MKHLPIFSFVLLLGICPTAQAWGPLGHRLITETAALLLDTPEPWIALIQRHRFELGMYATYPDSIFRLSDGNEGKTEGPLHFFSENGQLPKRVEQFQKLAQSQFSSVKEISSGYVSGMRSSGDTRQIFEGLYLLGIQAHYLGDAAMPFHTTADFNGWKIGQGGIHFYLETDCINVLEPGLAQSTLDLARNKKDSWLSEWKATSAKPLAVLHHLLEDSQKAISPTAATDLKHVVLKASRADTNTPALRKPPETGCLSFRSILIERLAKGAVLTAFFWKTVLPSGTQLQSGPLLQFSDIQMNAQFIPLK